MLMSILVLVIFFIAGLFTTNLPTKKFFAWFIAFTVKNSSNLASSTKNMVKNTEKKRSPANNGNKDEIIGKVFATFDKNSDGFITKQELRVSLKSIGMAMEDGDIEDLIKNVDINGDGLIDLEEFRESFALLLSKGEEGKADEEVECKKDQNDNQEESERDLLQEAFDVFDEDRDGLITVEELGLVLSSLGFNQVCNLEDCKKMIKSADMDGDGMVNFDEFKKMMRAGQGFVPFS